MIKSGELLIFIFLLSTISASCNSSQIDINSASADDLDKLAGIGSVKAMAIIESRPFSSVEDMIKVKGIGNSTLTKIKEQELACVSEDLPVAKNYSVQSHAEENISDEGIYLINNSKEEITTSSTPIILNAKTIKTENNSEVLKKNLPFYGLIAMGIIFGALLLLKGRKRKNEFN